MEDIIANKIKKLTPLMGVSVAQNAKKMKENGLDIIDLSIGEPCFKTPIYIQQAAKDAIDSGLYFGYAPIGGYRDLREAIAKKACEQNHIRANYENIVVCNGAKEALSLILTTILNPEDEIIVFTPYWLNYQQMIQLNQGVVVQITNDYKNNFVPSLEDIKKSISPKTKAILFSNPSNPTGFTLTKNYLKKLAGVLLDHKSIIVISDEIYEYLNFQKQHFSIGSLEEIAERVVTVNGLSKAYAMTGWRVGYLIANKLLANTCIRIQSQTTSGAASISQRAALAAINGGMVAIDSMRDTYLSNAEYVYHQLTTHTKLKAQRPQGAFYLFLDMSAYIRNSNKTVMIANEIDLSKFILEKAYVCVTPGTDMGFCNHIRLSVASSKEDLENACKRIIEILKSLS